MPQHGACCPPMGRNATSGWCILLYLTPPPGRAPPAALAENTTSVPLHRCTMTLLLPLLRAARQLPVALSRPRLPSGSQLVALGPAATGGGSAGSTVLATSASSPCALHSSSSSSSRQAGSARQQRRRRGVTATAGRRGNLFMDDAAARQRPNEEQSAAVGACTTLATACTTSQLRGTNTRPLTGMPGGASSIPHNSAL